MLFIFPTLSPQSFWMKNTLISLDMIFVNDARQVVGLVANAEPLALQSRSVANPSRFVVEVNGGFAAARGIEVGTAVSFENIDLTRVR